MAEEEGESKPEEGGGQGAEQSAEESDADGEPGETRSKATATKNGLICPESDSDLSDLDYACRGKKKKKKKKKKVKKQDLGAVPVQYNPCPHLHFKFETVDRNGLTKKQHMDLLSTPRGYVWEPEKELRYVRKGKQIKEKRRTKGLKRGEKKTGKSDKQYIGHFLCEVWNSLPPKMVDQLNQLLVEEFGMSEEEADEFIKKQKECAQSGGKKKKSFCPPNLKVGVRHKWVKAFSKIFASKVTDYVVMMLSCRRTPRVRKLADCILKHFCDITGEKTTLSSPKTNLQRLLVFIADRVAIWLNSLIKDQPCKDIKDAAVEVNLEPQEEKKPSKQKVEEAEEEEAEAEAEAEETSKPPSKPPSKPASKPVSGEGTPTKPESKPSSKPPSKPPSKEPSKQGSKEPSPGQGSKEPSQSPSKQKVEEGAEEEAAPEETPAEVPPESAEEEPETGEEEPAVEVAEEEMEVEEEETVEEEEVEEAEEEPEEALEPVESEVSVESLPLVPPMALRDKGVVYHITRGDGSFYNVQQLSSGTVAEKIADVRKREKPPRTEKKLLTESPLTLETMKEWADWAARATAVAEEWTKWIDSTVNTAETSAKIRKGEMKADDCLKGWRERTKLLGDEIAKKRKELKEEGEVWKKKTDKASEQIGPEKETKVTDLTATESAGAEPEGEKPEGEEAPAADAAEAGEEGGE